MSVTPIVPVDPAQLAYLTTTEAAAYLRFPTADAFRTWARRHAIAPCRTGRKLLFLRRDLDKAVQPAHRVRSFRKVSA